MRTLIQFIVRIEPGLYALAALGILLAIRSFFLGQQARRVAIYPLEREAASNRQSRALSALLALILLSAAVYIMANVVAPNMADFIGTVATPTPVIFLTQQATPTEARLLYPTITPTPGLPPGAGSPPTPTPGQAVNGCTLFGATITSPVPNQTVTGQVVVRGQANVISQAQYKFELRGPATGNAWVVVATSTVPVPEGVLGSFDATSLAPGNYVLRLTIQRTDNAPTTPCEVPIILVGPGGVIPPTPTP